nr:1-phosphofructokinase [uncultured Actinotalea sp.]
MIVTVTLNPSLDRTMDVAELRHGQVNRALSTHLHPGGKGVNVTRALLANAVPSRAVLPVAGPEGDQLVQLLHEEGVAAVVVPVSGRTRSNVSVADRHGTVTKINEPGTPLAPSDLDVVLERALGAAPPGSWLVLCGSLPPGAPPQQYADMTRRAAAHGMRVAVDTSGAALRHAVAAAPELVKPNAEELAEAVGRPLDSRADVVAAAQELRRRGARRVLVSLGGAGAVLVDDDGVALGESGAVAPRSTVGAGDAFLAGFLAAEESATTAPGPARSAGALRQALAWGAAAVQLPGSQMPGPGDIDPGSASVLTGPSVDARLLEPLVGTG